MMKTPKKYTEEEGLHYAAALCVRAEQCEYDLRRKLSVHGLNGNVADRIIDYLYDNNFLNEERYARAFALDKARFSKWGRIKIRAALFVRKIQRDTVEQALEAIDEKEYLEILQKMVDNFAEASNLRERDERLKLVRRLVARGFELPLINRAVEKSLHEDN